MLSLTSNFLKFPLKFQILNGFNRLNHCNDRLIANNFRVNDKFYYFCESL